MANALPTMGASDRNPRKALGTHYTTPVGGMLNDNANLDDNVSAPVDNAERARRNKKLQFVSAELKRMRYFRRQYDLRRAHYYRQYLGQRDDKYYPDNLTKRSNTFVPYPFSTVENIVSRTLDAFFSMEDWFETKAKPPYSQEDQADQMQMAMQDKLHKTDFISAFEQLIRNLVIYGQNAIKVDWDFRYTTVTSRVPVYYQEPVMQPLIGPDGQPMVDPQTGAPAMQPVVDPQTGQPAMQPVIGPDGQPMIQGYQAKQEEVPRACPRFTVIDVYDYLYDPDGAYEAHLTERTWRDLQEEQQASLEAMKNDPNRQPAYFQEGLDALGARLSNEENADEIVIRLAEFWNRNDNTWTIMTFGEDPEGISFKDLRASFRATAYSPYKRRIYGGETILLWDGDNPFFHKRSPILHTDFIKLPNEAFGLGAIEIISDLSEALNRFVNMIADNWNIGINHRYAYDINAEIDHESLQRFNVPGGFVGTVGDPSKVIFPLPQFTPSAGDYQIMEVYRPMIEMAAGISDFYNKGVGGGGGNKTATGIQQIIGESNYRLKMFIRNIEVDILQPLLEMCASMIQQFVDRPWDARNPKADVPGQPPTVTVDPKALIGTYQFNIVAANYATSKIVRQRNLMALAQVMKDNPFINVQVATREMLKTFEIKHIDQIMKSDQQVQQEQQQNMQMQMMQAQMQHQMELEKIHAKGQADALVAANSPSPVTGGGEPIAPGHVSDDKDDKKKKGDKDGAPAQAGPPGAGKGGRGPKSGRPAKSQFEGKIPGEGVTTMAKKMGGAGGTAALGLSQLGNLPPAE
jgi:hypothetical protein